MLTDAKLRTSLPPGKYSDGEGGVPGFHLHITAAGGRYWRLAYRHAGKQKTLALGVHPEVSLKEARAKATQARQAVLDDRDPGAEKQAAKAKTQHEAANSLRVVAEDWLAHQASRWEPKTRIAVEASLSNHVYPELGRRPLAEIQPLELLACIKRIEAKGSMDVAARVLQRSKAIWRWAFTHGRIEANPMRDLVPSEMLKPRQVKHRPAMAERDLPAFLVQLDDYGHDPHTVHALKLLLLTAARPGEVRGATWDEIDLDGALWIIPAARMKMRTEHRVPLSRQAVEVLRSMQRFSGDSALVFPSPFYPGKPLSENTLNSALARMGHKGSATAHGFRALFSTVANESGLWSPDAIERQLAHVERNQVRAAYHRSTYMKDRAELMQWWADHLDNCAQKSLAPLLERKNSGDTGTSGDKR